MTPQLVLPDEELARKAVAIKTFSLGLIAAASVGVIVAPIIWLFDRTYPIIPITLVAVAVALTGLLTYWLVRVGRVKFAGHFFVIGFLFEASIITTLFGGVTGPLALIYLIPILVTGMVIGISSFFRIANLAVVLYLAMIPVEQAGLLPQLITLETKGTTIPLIISSRVIVFYLIAFLGWFASSRLDRALQSVRRYATELQTANEELQATEEELRVSNEELQAANEELRETQEQLIRSEKLAAIGQLAGGVGHELRNPLGAIKNAVYYIKGKVAKNELGQKEPRVLEFLNIMDDEINSSNKIINDLLGFSRVGKPSVSPTRIEGVIEEALSRTPIPENIELTKGMDTALPEVEIDPDQIQQVLINIITNAIQAMPEGGKLTIGAREEEKSLEMEIADTGGGIPGEAMDKIFDPLFTTKAKGIGLGLAVCKSIIDRHEGHIEVRSKVGKGTTFRIKLPLRAA